ncbi:MAG: DR2241 family protein [Chthoniobacterales bacterium]
MNEEAVPLPCWVGEILIDRTDDEQLRLCHLDDAERVDLKTDRMAGAAAEIARFDDAGKYRPLKTAPNLRHGWQLILRNIEQLWLAMDFFYPGRMDALQAFGRNALVTTPLRTTLARQSGMYRIAGQISDEQVNELVARVCRSEGGCLRAILWDLDGARTPASSLLPAEKFDPAYDQTRRSEGTTIPLLCPEACNLLVSEAREVVKSSAR